MLRPTFLRFLEASGILISAALWLVLAARAWRAVHTIGDMGIALLAFVTAYAAADWASGLAHWFCDTFFEEDTPLVGPAVIQPFREHHRDPLAMTRHGFLELNGNNCLGMVVPLAVAVWQLPAATNGGSATFWMFFFAFFFLAVAVTNRLHGWAHAASVPSIVRWLQRRGVILSPERHADHHRAPYAQAYCVTHGWMNSVLDRIGFFERATRLLSAVGVPRSTAS